MSGGVAKDGGVNALGIKEITDFLRSPVHMETSRERNTIEVETISRCGSGTEERGEGKVDAGREEEAPERGLGEGERGFFDGGGIGSVSLPLVLGGIGVSVATCCCRASTERRTSAT